MIQKRLEPPRSLYRRIVGNVCAALTVCLLFPSLVAVNGLQLASLVLLPFSRRAFRVFNRTCANYWWGLCVWWTEKLYRVKAVYSGDDVPERENAIVIVNHQQMSDIIALFGFGWRKHRLGDMKYVVKEIIKYVPGVGWGMLFLDCLFLKRNWESDRGLIERTFSKFKRDKIPAWLVSFSEGTRITPAKLEKSRAYAKENGLEPTRNVMLPRTKGFVAAVHGLRDHIDAIYDVTIAYPTGIPTLWQMFAGYVGEFNLHVRRFAVDSVPAADRALSDWLTERFREKDRLLESFHKTGAFSLSPALT